MLINYFFFFLAVVFVTFFFGPQEQHPQAIDFIFIYLIASNNDFSLLNK